MNARSKASAMMMCDVLSPAYVLHSRKYQDTSLIVELLTRDEGRVSAVVRGARSKRGRQAGVWQPFMPLLVSSFGRGELRTVKHAEFLQTAFYLTGDNLLLGLYVNELLVRVLSKFESVPGVFVEYQALINELATISGVSGGLLSEGFTVAEPVPRYRNQAALRLFELQLLTELGYGITFTTEAGGGAAVVSGRHYRFVPDEGFYPLAPDGDASTTTYPGEHLLAIEARQFDVDAVDRSAKYIIRLAFAGLLGGKPLNARALFKPIAYGVKATTAENNL